MLARISAHCWVDTLYLHIVGFLSSMVWGGIYVLFHSCTWLFHLFLMDWDLFQRPSKSFPIFTFVSYFWFIIKSEKSVQQPEEHEVLFGHRRAPVRPRHLARALDSCSKPVCFHSLSRALGCWLCFCLVFGGESTGRGWWVVQRLKTEGLSGSCSSKLVTECAFQDFPFFIKIFIQKVNPFISVCHMSVPISFVDFTQTLIWLGSRKS